MHCLCSKLVYCVYKHECQQNKNYSLYTGVTLMLLVVGLPVDPLSPASLSHQGLIGNPNLTVAQMLWILPHKSRAIFLKNDEKNSPAGGIFLSNFMFVFLKKFL